MKGIKKIKTGLLASSVFVAMLGLGQVAAAADITIENDVRQVGHVSWQKSGTTSFQAINASELPANEANLIFIRPLDNDPLQTSANIAIDGRFQVSLQPGHYSQIKYCSGQHNVTAVPTGAKINDLTDTYSHLIDFVPQQNHYIFVDVDEVTGAPNLSELDEEYALNLLSTQPKQTHQISRVVRDCPPAVIVEPEPAPVLEEEVSIELEVLFDNDKSIVKPQYYKEVEDLANFMNKYSNTTTVIEGHTDSNASEDYNQKLSERRANAIKLLLIKDYGITPDRLTTIGYGELRPRATNATAEGRQLNRRTIAVVRERIRVDQDGNQIID